MLLASVIGGYTLIGGLGATFYVSYFNTALIFMLIIMLMVEVSTHGFSFYLTHTFRFSSTLSSIRRTRSDPLRPSLTSLPAGKLPRMTWATRADPTSPSSARVRRRRRSMLK
jgi:hypothetical protein